MFIPGWLVCLATFPGVIVHEMAHQFACRLARVAVLDVCYFRFGNPAGYVVHEKPISAYQSIVIGAGPLIFNTVIGAVIAAPGAIPVLQFESGGPLDFFLIWLGVSIAMHSFPSRSDAGNMWQSLWSEQSPVLAKIVGSPLVFILYMGAFGSIIWLDLFYGLAVAMAIPKMLVYLLA